PARSGLIVAAALRVGARAAVPAPAPVQREAVGLAVVAVLALRRPLMMRRLLRASNERRQSIDIALGRCIALLRARLMRLVLVMRREGLGVGRDIGLRLAGAVGRFGAAAERRLVVFAIIEVVVAGALRFAVRAGEVGIVLAKLLLRRSDHAIVVLGMLVV